jgi:hypothetical protein
MSKNRLAPLPRTSVHQALDIWPVLRGCAANSPDEARITYGNLAVAIDYPSRRAARSLRHALGLIGWYCLDHGQPCLNSLAVSQKTMECGGSEVLHEGLTPGEERANVVKVDWGTVELPTVRALRDTENAHRASAERRQRRLTR